MSANLYEKIKANVDIVDVIQKYVPVIKKNSGGVCLCPFHNDTKPSLSISSKLQIFNCFVCDSKGDCIAFVAKYLDIPYFEAAKEIINEFNLDHELLVELDQHSNYNIQNERSYLINDKLGLFLHNFLCNNQSKTALHYLHQRQLDDQLINHFNLGYAPNDNKALISMITNPQYVNLPFKDENEVTYKDLLNIGFITIDSKGEYQCLFVNRIVIPIYDANNHLVGFSGRILEASQTPKYINTPATQIFNKDSILYNYNQVLKLSDYSAVYLVEGFMDVFGLYRADIHNVVATMGVALTAKHLDLLAKNHKINSIILAYDNDDAGIEATIKAAKLIGRKFKTYVVSPYKQYAKDFDELFCLHGKEKVVECANKIYDFVSYFIILKGNKNKNDQIKMQDFLNEAFEVIYSCGYELEHENYFQRLKNVFDKSKNGNKNYSIESFQKAYQTFKNAKDIQQSKTVSNSSTSHSTNFTYQKSSSFSNNNCESPSLKRSNSFQPTTRYNKKALTLNQLEYQKKYKKFGHHYDDTIACLQNIKPTSSEFDTNYLMHNVEIIELNLLASFFLFKSSFNEFKKLNEDQIPFSSTGRSILFSYIDGWYSQHPHQGPLILNQYDIDSFDINNFTNDSEKAIKTFHELKPYFHKIQLDQINTWRLIIFDWLINRYKLVISKLHDEVANNHKLITINNEEFKKYHEKLIKCLELRNIYKK